MNVIHLIFFDRTKNSTPGKLIVDLILVFSLILMLKDSVKYTLKEWVSWKKESGHHNSNEFNQVLNSQENLSLNPPKILLNYKS